MLDDAVTRVFSEGGTDHTESSESFDWLESFLLKDKGVPLSEISGFLSLQNSHALKNYALHKGYLTQRQVEVARQLQQNLEEIQLRVSSENGQMLGITVRSHDGAEFETQVRSSDMLGPTLAALLGFPRTQVKEHLRCFTRLPRALLVSMPNRHG